MRGPDPVTEPDAGVAHLYLGGSQPRHQARQHGAGAGRNVGIEREPGALRANPGPDQWGIVISRHDDHLTPGPEPSAERAQHRLGHLERPGGTAGRQLGQIPEQHETIEVGQRVQQPRLGTGPAQHVVARPVAQVQIGDDQRPQSRRHDIRRRTVRRSGGQASGGQAVRRSGGDQRRGPACCGARTREP